MNMLIDSEAGLIKGILRNSIKLEQVTHETGFCTLNLSDPAELRTRIQVYCVAEDSELDAIIATVFRHIINVKPINLDIPINNHAIWILLSLWHMYIPTMCWRGYYYPADVSRLLIPDTECADAVIHGVYTWAGNYELIAPYRLIKLKSGCVCLNIDYKFFGVPEELSFKVRGIHLAYETSDYIKATILWPNDNTVVTRHKLIPPELLQLLTGSKTQ